VDCSGVTNVIDSAVTVPLIAGVATPIAVIVPGQASGYCCHRILVKICGADSTGTGWAGFGGFGWVSEADAPLNPLKFLRGHVTHVTAI
jgi:hypothetical protein